MRDCRSDWVIQRAQRRVGYVDGFKVDIRHNQLKVCENIGVRKSQFKSV
jgi:hypothetical protein